MVESDLDSIIKLALAKGSDAEYRAWIQRLPSCISGTYGEWLEDGTGRCVAAHIRRAGESGTAFKAPYACVPMTQFEHFQQHQRGESAFGGKAFFDEQRIVYLRRWVAL